MKVIFQMLILVFQMLIILDVCSVIIGVVVSAMDGDNRCRNN